MDFAAGTPIGDYVLDGYVGAGSFGVVWRGHNASTGEPVAVKLLTGAMSSEDSAAMRADVEVLAATAAGESQHVVRVLGGGTEPVPYIVMEYIEGRDLAVLLREQGKLTSRRTLDVGLAIADALRVLNAAGIVHRDIKPANVMVDAQGVIKLADFGVAKIVGYESITMTGQVAMTMAYAAPEIWDDDDGGLGRPSLQSDLYALGILLYECLTGVTPFRGNYGVLYRAHRERSPDLDSLPAETPASLRALIEWCLQKRQADRPQIASECLLVLQRAGVELAEASGQPPANEPKRFGRWLRVAPHSTQPWAWLCRQESTGQQATVELHFSSDLTDGEVLRRRVTTNLELLESSRLMLHPGESWTAAPQSQFQFWVARKDQQPASNTSVAGTTATLEETTNVARLPPTEKPSETRDYQFETAPFPAVEDAPVPGLAVEMVLRQLRDGSGGQPGEYHLILKNSKPIATTLHLNARDDANGLAFELQTSCTLSASGEDTVRVRVRPRARRWFGRRRHWPFTIVAEGDDGSSEPPRVTISDSFDEWPPRWPVLTGASVLGIAVISGLALLIGGNERPLPPASAATVCPAGIPECPLADAESPVPPTPTRVPAATPTQVVIPSPPPTAAPLQDRFDCEEIRKDPVYRSTSERTWYLANCQLTTPTRTVGVVPPAPGAPPAAVTTTPTATATAANAATRVGRLVDATWYEATTDAKQCDRSRPLSPNSLPTGHSICVSYRMEMSTPGTHIVRLSYRFSGGLRQTPGYEITGVNVTGSGVFLFSESDRGPLHIDVLIDGVVAGGFDSTVAN